MIMGSGVNMMLEFGTCTVGANPRVAARHRRDGAVRRRQARMRLCRSGTELRSHGLGSNGFQGVITSEARYLRDHRDGRNSFNSNDHHALRSKNFR